MIDTSSSSTSSLGNESPKPPTPESIYGYGALPDTEIPTIKLYGSASLREPNLEVMTFNREVTDLVHRMAAAMYRANGIGLAAPQVGVPTRIVVVSDEATNGTTLGYPIAFINPVVLEEASKLETILEGCLSFPRITVKVARPRWVRVRARTQSGTAFEVRAEGLYARVIAHEIEHLNGVLIIDHLSQFKKRIVCQRVQKWKRHRKRLNSR